MVVTRDEPGRAIELHEETISFWKNGGGRILGLIPFAMFPVLALGTVFREPGAVTHPGAWIPVTVLTVWLVIVATIGAFMLNQSRRLSLLSVDRGTGEWVFEEWAPIGLFARRTVVPLGSVERVEVWTVRTFGASEGAPLPIRMKLFVADGRGLNLDHPMVVHGLDKTEEALDLALRFAHAAGLGYHRVAWNDHLELRLVLSRAAEAGSTPVPPLSGPSEYERDQVGIPALHLEREAPPFDPASFASEHRVERWEPGKEVLLVRPASPGQAMQDSLGCGVLFGFASISVWAVSLACEIPAFMPATAMVAGLFLCVLAILHHRRVSMRGQVRVDWGSRSMSIERFGSLLRIPFDLLERIDVVGLRNEHLTTEGQAPYAEYRLQVFARLTRPLREASRTELIVETKPFRDQPEPPYRSGLPFGLELARALGVPCEYRDFK